jgi:hypothetical protein
VFELDAHIERMATSTRLMYPGDRDTPQVVQRLQMSIEGVNPPDSCTQVTANTPQAVLKPDYDDEH